MKTPAATAHPRSSRVSRRAPAAKIAPRRRIAVVFIIVLVTVVIGLDFVSGSLLRSVINRKFTAMPGYSGHVEGARVSLVRGRVKLLNVIFTERGREAEPPLARIPVAELNLSYLALFRGVVNAHMRVEHPQFTVVKTSDGETTLPGRGDDGDKKKTTESPTGAEAKIARWQNTLRQTFPVEIETLAIEDGTLRFLDRTQQPEIDVALTQFHLTASDLRTRPAGGASHLPATIQVSATTTGEGQLTIHLTADPFSPQPRFDSQFELRALSLPALNPFLLAYANADVARGTFEFDSEIHAEGGHYQGYVKPFFKDLDFKTASDKDKNALQLLTKKAVSAVATVLKNKDEQKVATKAPFAGDFASNDVDLWTTIANLLHNAFVQGIREGFEGQTPSR